MHRPALTLTTLEDRSTPASVSSLIYMGLNVIIGPVDPGTSPPAVPPPPGGGTVVVVPPPPVSPPVPGNSTS